jgi:hypothetical protein
LLHRCLLIFLEKCAKLVDEYKIQFKKGEKFVDKYEIEGVVSAVNAVSVLSNGEEKLLFEIQITGAENFCVKRKEEVYNLFWLQDEQANTTNKTEVTIENVPENKIMLMKIDETFIVRPSLTNILSQAFVSKIKLQLVIENNQVIKASSVN